MTIAQLNAAHEGRWASFPTQGAGCEPPSESTAHLSASTVVRGVQLRGVELRAFADALADILVFAANRRRNGVACALCGHRHHEHELQSFKPRCARCGAPFFPEG